MRLRSDCTERQPPADQHRGRPDDGHGPDPDVRAAEGRAEPRQQVDARLDHRRRVEVGADRGRRFHRGGQPEVEGELRRLGERPGQDQQQGRHVERVRAQAVALGQERGQLQAPARLPEEQQAGQQRQAAPAGHQQRLQGRRAGLAALVVEADEQVRADAGQLPEHEQGEEVVGEDQPQHGGHEHQQEGVEPAELGVPGEVAARVDQDQRADAADEQGEQQAQPVQGEGQADPQRGHPVVADVEGLTRRDRPQEAGEVNGQGQGQQGEHPAGGAARQAVQPRCGQGQDESREDCGRHAHSLPFR